MDRKEAAALLFGDGSTFYDKNKVPLEKRLLAHSVHIKTPGYQIQSAEAEYHGEILGDICEALFMILEERRKS
jgi:hypothetical protein